MHVYFCQIDNVDLLLSIFTAEYVLSIVQQIIELAAVDLIKRDPQLQVGVLVEQVDDIVRRQKVQTGHLAVRGPHHGPSFAAARLPVGKTSCLVALECLSNERQDAIVVDILVVCIAIKGIIDAKIVLFNVFGKINFKPIDELNSRKRSAHLNSLTVRVLCETMLTMSYWLPSF